MPSCGGTFFSFCFGFSCGNLSLTWEECRPVLGQYLTNQYGTDRCEQLVTLRDESEKGEDVHLSPLYIRLEAHSMGSSCTLEAQSICCTCTLKAQ